MTEIINLQFGKAHAIENEATHHRGGDIYKVTDTEVLCWDCGEWVRTESHTDIDGWLSELSLIDLEKVR